VAACIVELNVVFRVVWCSPQVQVAVGLVVTIWLAIPRAPEPPRRAILSAPCAELGVLAVHGTSLTAASASLAAVAGASDINDEVWCIQRSS